MPTDTAINRLLYAILSQKCLKDIDWNKVANNPILNGEITNGHAARMRYSRFKRQMDTAIGIAKKPRTNTPRKNKIDKSKPPVKKENDRLVHSKEDEEGGDAKRVKLERADTSSVLGEGRGRVKMEPRDRDRDAGYIPGMPFTPQSQNSTPSPGMGHHHDYPLGEMDDMATSFGFPGEELYGPMMAHEYGNGMGMGMPMAIPDSFEHVWHDQETRSVGGRGERHLISDNGGLVKNEPRWAEDYRR
ncbi:hypothetical protein BJ875DRAFT_150092 [Amylocarpus encephaloides]|uniref:Myb-like DNA-binding domain-containing protein n=1 Tax=Amylocarpus encephaloides TaxID=45428 RepID=A0A9P7YBH8_9HELO|nr:hypothetical protein BJ875DRAFT_150092 [Amylocarpus encephaloides]